MILDDHARSDIACCAQEIAIDVLGKPSSRSSTELRYGRRGSLSVAITGPKAGLWYNHETGNSGDMIAFVIAHAGLRFADAVGFCRQFAGLSDSYSASLLTKPRTALKSDRGRQAQLEADIQQRQAKAFELWSEARSIVGTPAEHYLTRRLGQHGLPEGMNLDCLRWHPTHTGNTDAAASSMLALMVDPLTRQPTGIERTFLTVDGLKIGNRKKWGLAGTVMLFDPEAEGDALTGLGLAEGIETALSVAVRYEWRPIWATLSAGTMRSFPVLPHVEALAIFADNDASQTGQDAAAVCCQRWADQEREAVCFIAPDQGTDFNDLMQAKGAA
ncbi:MAG: toprim domain-containing protein [Rhizobiaceae bacterium]